MSISIYRYIAGHEIIKFEKLLDNFNGRKIFSPRGNSMNPPPFLKMGKRVGMKLKIF